MSFSKSPIRFAASFRTSAFRHPTDRVRRGGPVISLRVHHAALMALEDKWLKRSLEQQVFFGEQEAIQHNAMSQDFRDKLKHLLGIQGTVIKDLQEEKKQDQERIEQGNMRNFKLLCAALDERTRRMTLQGNHNLLGALERMVYLAKLEEKVPPTVGIQEGLDKLAQRSEFTAVLQKEVQARKLVVEDVMACLNHLYNKVCHRTNANEDAMVIVRAARFTSNERAALVALLKLQNNWLHPLHWIEDTSRKGGKQRM